MFTALSGLILVLVSLRILVLQAVIGMNKRIWRCC